MLALAWVAIHLVSTRWKSDAVGLYRSHLC